MQGTGGAGSMTGVILLALLLGLACSSKVLQLNDANFNATILREPLLLLNFHAPWCGYCKTLKSVLEEVAEDVGDLNIE
ncbi:hypothetical protein B484DRAFT_403309, partial [Ochromonadaceae sp. CCMP2298]